MFNVKIKVKEGNNTMPRRNGRTNNYTQHTNSGYSSPTTTGSLRSSLASANRSPNNSLKRKDKRVRIVTTYPPIDNINQRTKQYGKQCMRVNENMIIHPIKEINKKKKKEKIQVMRLSLKEVWKNAVFDSFFPS